MTGWNADRMCFLISIREELRRRLEGRGTDTAEAIEGRLARARQEYREADFYDYLIVNDDLELAFDQLVAVVRAEKQNSVRYFPKIEE